VRRNAQNQLRLGPNRAKLGAQRLPRASVLIVFNRIHGAAVAQKKNWKSGRGRQGLKGVGIGHIFYYVVISKVVNEASARANQSVWQTRGAAHLGHKNSID
jgi:hypothetical protein